MEVMNAARFVAVEHMSDQVVKVGPGSLKSKPPMAIHVSSCGVFNAVNWEYRTVSERSVGIMLKETGSMAANAKLRCVRSSVMIWEG